MATKKQLIEKYAQLDKAEQMIEAGDVLTDLKSLTDKEEREMKTCKHRITHIVRKGKSE